MSFIHVDMVSQEEQTSYELERLIEENVLALAAQGVIKPIHPDQKPRGGFCHYRSKTLPDMCYEIPLYMDDPGLRFKKKRSSMLFFFLIPFYYIRI